MMDIQDSVDSDLPVGIVGLGYVGIPLALCFAQKLKVIGVDIDPKRVETLNQGINPLQRTGPDLALSRALADDSFTATTSFAALTNCQAVIFCVPTPLGQHREPNLAYITGAAHFFAPHLRKGQLVVLESTTYPGTTKDVFIPTLEHSGLQAGHDFQVAYSPEREDPGNKTHGTKNTPKIVGGLTPYCTDKAARLYRKVIDSVHCVTDLSTAEMVKITENVFRCVNIALVNELKMLTTRMGIDIWEVIAAAKTKPFGFMPFYPGPGLGGHCIPIDPFYLTWKAHEYGEPTRFIELAGEVNQRMPGWVVECLQRELNWREGRALRGCRVLLVGAAYKPNVSDTRESPTFAIQKILLHRGADVWIHDPLVDLKSQASVEHLSAQTLKSFDAAIIVTNHACVDHAFIAFHVPLVVDTRNALLKADHPNVVKA